MEFILKAGFVISLILTAFSQETELKPLIILFPVFYLFIYFLLKEYTNKLIFLGLEISLIIYFIYLTGNPYISLLFFILLPAYLNRKNQLFIVLISGILPVIFSFYLTGYIDFILLIIFFSFYIPVFYVFNSINEHEKRINDLKNNLITLTSDFIKKIDNNKHFELWKFSNLSLKDTKKALFNLYTNLNSSGITLFDIEKNKCITVGEFNCDKNLLEYIQPEIYTFKYNGKSVLFLPIYNNNEISKVFFFFYKSEKLIDNLNIFYYLKLKFENELLSNL